MRFSVWAAPGVRVYSEPRRRRSNYEPDWWPDAAVIIALIIALYILCRS